MHMASWPPGVQHNSHIAAFGGTVPGTPELRIYNGHFWVPLSLKECFYKGCLIRTTKQSSRIVLGTWFV
ncbi:UNVERIFIED_ORG: hypothetical protein BDU10_6007 [Burkholderia sp. CF145]